MSGYGGAGTPRWAAGHVLGIDRLDRPAREKAPAGSHPYAAAEEGTTVRGASRPLAGT